MKSRLFYAVFKVLSCAFLLLLVSINSSAQANWTSLPFTTQRSLYEIEYYDGQGIVVVGDSGLVVWKGNSGGEWTLIQAPTLSPLKSVEKLRTGSGNNSRNYFLGNNRRAYRFGIVGSTVVEDTLPGWPSIPLNTSRIVNLHISTLTETRYGLPCEGGRVMAYKSDLNPTSYQIQLSSLKPIEDLYPFNSWYVLAVGDSGKIWRTNSLTAPFIQIGQMSTTHKLNRIFGKNDSQIWVAGNGGTLLSSGDAGLTWNKIALPTSQNLTAGFVKGSAIWICGDSGTILLSTDNGANWQAEASGTVENLFDIKQIGNSVYAVGEKGTFITVNIVLSNVQHTRESPIRIWQQANQVFLTSEQDWISNVLVFNIHGRKIDVSSKLFENGLTLKLPPSGLYMVWTKTGSGYSSVHKVLVQE